MIAAAPLRPAARVLRLPLSARAWRQIGLFLFAYAVYTAARFVTIGDLGTAEEGLTSVALAPDESIIAGGVVAPSPNGDLAVVRFYRRGHLDRGLGHQGVARAYFGGRDDRVRGIAVQPDGKVVAVGSSETDFALARFDVGTGL